MPAAKQHQELTAAMLEAFKNESQKLVQTMIRENFFDLLSRVDGIVESWKTRALTLIGKITVVNSLVNTLFVHKLLALPTPPPPPPENFFCSI